MRENDDKRILPILELLVSHGADLDSDVPLLYLVAFRNLPDVVDYLVPKTRHNDLNLQIPSFDHLTALHIAAASGFAAVVFRLLVHGADANLRDDQNELPIDHTAQAGEWGPKCQILLETPRAVLKRFESMLLKVGLLEIASLPCERRLTLLLIAGR